MWRRLVPLLILVMLAAVACGDDGSVFEQGGPTTPAGSTGAPGATTSTAGATTSTAAPGGLSAAEQAVADQIAADLLAEGIAEETGLSIDEEAAQCLASQVVAVIGLDRLEELKAQAGSGDIGAAMELMTPQEQATMIGVVLQGAGGQPPCLDVQGMIVAALAESGLSENSAQCVAQAFTQGDVLQNLLGAALAGEGAGPGVGGGEDELNPEIFTQLMTVMMGCLTPEELAQMGDLGDLGG